MAKVIKYFRYSGNGKIYNVGQEFDGKHVKELRDLGYLEKPKRTIRPKSEESK